MIIIVMLLVAVFGAAQGLTFPLFSFILEQWGVSSTVIGLNSAMTPLGLVLSGPLIPWFARRFGAAQVALASSLVLTGCFVVMGAFPHLGVWFATRFILGFAINGLYIPSETWINLLATPSRRGQLLGLYTCVLAAGFGLGPFVLVVTGTEGWPPFLFCIGFALATVGLLAAYVNRLPPIHADRTATILRFLPKAPRLAIFVAIAAAFDYAALSLLPIYGLARGQTETIMALAVGVLIVGNIVLQLPIGWLCDRWSKHAMSVCLCILTIAGALVLPIAITHPLALWPLLFFWGSAAYGIYLIALVELGSRFSGAMLLAGNATFAVMYGAGGLVGPPLLGTLMDSFGPGGFPAGLVLLYGLLLVMLLRRGPKEPKPE